MVQISVRFLLVVQCMMQIKFNFNNCIFYGMCLPQLGSGPTAYAVVAGDCDWPILIIMTSFHYVPYVACVACVALAGNPA